MYTLVRTHTNNGPIVGGRIPQNPSEATLFGRRRPEDGKIDWKKPAGESEREMRAFDPWQGSYSLKEEKEGKIKTIKIMKARILKTIDVKKYSIGKTLVAPQNELCVQTGQGFLTIEKLQLEGKRPISSEEFLRGHLDFIGTILK